MGTFGLILLDMPIMVKSPIYRRGLAAHARNVHFGVVAVQSAHTIISFLGRIEMRCTFLLQAAIRLSAWAMAIAETLRQAYSVTVALLLRQRLLTQTVVVCSLITTHGFSTMLQPTVIKG
jgi:hypothetical protein